MRASAGWSTLTGRLVLRALVNPRLALDLVRLTWSFRARDWYRRPPFLPLPPRDYVRCLRRRRRGAAARGRGPLREVAARNNAPMKRDAVQTVAVKRRALELGFDAVGVATLEPSAHAAELDQWLDAGYAGTMTYLHRQAKKRKHPAG